MLEGFITSKECEEDEPELPSYNEPGRILFHYIPQDEYDYGVEVFDHDGSAFWLQEAGFIDYAVQDMIDLELEGYYVIEGVTGRAWNDYWGEYDEEWSFTYCRRV